jgi:hypothetical protein
LAEVGERVNPESSVCAAEVGRWEMLFDEKWAWVGDLVFCAR